MSIVIGNPNLLSVTQLTETSHNTPGCASDTAHGFYISWAGVGNQQINFKISADGFTWSNLKDTKPDTTAKGTELALPPWDTHPIVGYPGSSILPGEGSHADGFTGVSGDALVTCINRPDKGGDVGLVTIGSFLYVATITADAVNIASYTGCHNPVYLSYDRPGDTSDYGIALGTYQGTLYYAYAGRDAAGTINVSTL